MQDKDQYHIKWSSAPSDVLKLNEVDCKNLSFSYPENPDWSLIIILFSLKGKKVILPASWKLTWNERGADSKQNHTPSLG